MKTIARIAAAIILTSGLLVACGNSSDACAAQGAPLPQAQQTYRPPAPKPPRQPTQKRTTSKVQDRTQPPKVQKKTQPKPTNWGGYNDRVNKRNWSQPYRKGLPVAPQPVIIHQYGNDYRTYPGYSGYYPVGIWPVGYGARYGCTPEREDTPAPTPTATVTVTATPTPEPTR
jgi:hypothetical protein